MSLKHTFLLGSILFSLAFAAQAQIIFRVGSKVGYSLSTASYQVADYPDYYESISAYRSGVEAGVVTQVGIGRHLAVQPALLYARKAVRYGSSYYFQPNNAGSYFDYTLGLNYLLLPLNGFTASKPTDEAANSFWALTWAGYQAASTSSETIIPLGRRAQEARPSKVTLCPVIPMPLVLNLPTIAYAASILVCNWG